MGMGLPGSDFHSVSCIGAKYGFRSCSAQNILKGISARYSCRSVESIAMLVCLGVPCNFPFSVSKLIFAACWPMHEEAWKCWRFSDADLTLTGAWPPQVRDRFQLMHQVLKSAPDAYRRQGQLQSLAALLGLQSRQSELDTAVAAAAICEGDASTAGPLAVALARKGYAPASEVAAMMVSAKDAASKLGDDERHLLWRHALIHAPSNKVSCFPLAPRAESSTVQIISISSIKAMLICSRCFMYRLHDHAVNIMRMHMERYQY